MIAQDNTIGIGLYYTKTLGIGGVIRQQIEDFQVEELTNRIETTNGKYLIAELTKKNWDIHHLVHDLARILRISQQRFGWAGTKDKRALTKQKISIWDVNEEDLSRIRLKDVELKPIGRSNNKISLGDLWGNRFKITIRDIGLSHEETLSRVKTITQELLLGGAPNFFGVQRFGEVRPVTHVVGEAIARGNFRDAALTYIARAFPDESEEIKKARQFVEDTGDYKEGLNLYPLRLQFERAMMNHLIAYPDDYTGAFKKLSPKLQAMFLHAYQSYIFNIILSRRIASGLSIHEAYDGDIVCFKNEMGLPDTSRLQKVTKDNLDGINNLINRGRAFVTAPLVGYETQFAEGAPGEIERAVVKELNVEPEGFKVPEMPELSSRGLRREIILSFKPEFSVEEDDVNAGKIKVTLEFSLQKGSYATTVLREYMKKL
ncbi:MAG: tRNA pseudouridine(13) synthase TruD [Candidatus Methanoperedens sp.]|nr:tRNA pseudouridine(13) synthase TruD [Candidatus Methanoperedens sp.]MCZ7404657.1 tRNA pseudouridine(13) synthase TruD [Candidatus Methanoperedens sp.]